MYHCIPCRHFIFSALGGHVINRSQVMSPPYRSYTVTSFTVYILYKCTRTVIVCFTTSIFLWGIHSKCMHVIYVHYITSLYIVCMYCIYKCVVHALALLDCLVASFVNTHKYIFKHVPVVYTAIESCVKRRINVVNFIHVYLSPCFIEVYSRDHN